jgi:hypothetical protein
MIVELIGSTGAGKSSVAGRLQSLSAVHQTKALLAEQFVLQCYGLRVGWLRSRGARSLVIDVLSFPWFVRFAARRPRFCWFVVVTVYRGVELPLFSLNVLRNIIKQMGMHELLTQRSHAGDLILLDEGLVHQAHSLFVHPNAARWSSELERFVAEVPLPDLLVLVEAPTAEVVRRTLQRGHPRLPGPRVALTGQFVERAERVFREVARLAARRTAIRVVRNDRLASASVDRSLDDLVRYMLLESRLREVRCSSSRRCSSPN